MKYIKALQLKEYTAIAYGICWHFFLHTRLQIHLHVIFCTTFRHNIITGATLKKKVRNSSHYIKTCACTGLGGPIQAPICSIQASLWGVIQKYNLSFNFSHEM
jgi:hypothetical protein